MDALLEEKSIKTSRCPSPQTEIIGQSDPLWPMLRNLSSGEAILLVLGFLGPEAAGR